MMRTMPLRWLLATLLVTAGCDPKDTDTSTTTDTATPTSGCEDPTTLLDSSGEPTGYEQCADGAINRAEAISPTDVGSEPSCAGDEDWKGCTADDECTDGTGGVCLHYESPKDTGTSCGCAYTCASDDDCGSGAACLAVDTVDTNLNLRQCVPADCATDSDCDSGECGVSTYFDGCGYNTRLACREPAVDTCRTDADCEETYQQCAMGPSGWECLAQECDIGRPLLIDGEARRAPTAARADWSASLAAVAVPPEDIRQRLSDRWRDIARLEHASVASFARFTLQMMALGAPPDILLAIQQAAADEIRHAQITFALAGRYSGAPVGPGAMRLDDAAPAFDVDGVLAGLIAEACLGETIGAAEAAEAARRCEDPAVSALLTEIAEDEARHAGLAWRSLKWILSALAPERRAWARTQLEAAAEALLARTSAPDEALAPYGIVTTGPAFRRAVIAQVVWPAFDTLTEDTAGAQMVV